jgi:quercetin dioxygenase-like cupin family protein
VNDHHPPAARHAVWSELPIENVFPGITRQTVQATNQTLIRYVYEPGSVFPQHLHPEEQVTAVLSGQIEFTVGDDLHLIGPGEVAVIPPNVPHGAKVVGDLTVETLNTLSPRRDTNLYPGDSNGSNA